MSDGIDFSGGLGDLTGVPYTGIVDTGTGFTGSSTMQDVQVGSPLVLDTSVQIPQEFQNTVSVTDLLPQVPTSTWNPTGAELSQMLAGVSDTPVSSVGATAQTNTPVAVDSSQQSWAALTSLSKFGASIAGLFGQTQQRIQPAPASGYTYAGAQQTGAYNSGPFTLITLVVIGALILLLFRGD
jgi:hypothetical protein